MRQVRSRGKELTDAVPVSDMAPAQRKMMARPHRRRRPGVRRPVDYAAGQSQGDHGRQVPVAGRPGILVSYIGCVAG